MASGSNRPLLSTLESRQMWKLLFPKMPEKNVSPLPQWKAGSIYCTFQASLLASFRFSHFFQSAREGFSYLPESCLFGIFGADFPSFPII